MSEKKKKKGGSLVLLAAASLLRQEDGLDVGEHASLGDSDALEQTVQLLVVADGELKVARVDPLLFVVTGRVASQLEDLCRQVLHDGCQVDWGAGTDTLGVVAQTEETVNSPNWELESCTGGAALSLGAGLASLSTSRHGEFTESFRSEVAEKDCET